MPHTSHDSRKQIPFTFIVNVRCSQQIPNTVYAYTSSHFQVLFKDPLVYTSDASSAFEIF